MKDTTKLSKDQRDILLLLNTGKAELPLRSPIVASLVRKGLATKETSLSDGRARLDERGRRLALLTITDAGRERAKRLKPVIPDSET
jgi:DNA-binding MarR family transcriptional regulator